MKTMNRAHRNLQTCIAAAEQQSAEHHPDALQSWTRTAARSVDVMGPTHRWTLFCLNNVGKTLVEMGDYEGAIPVLLTSLRAAREIHGCIDFSVEHASQSLGKAYAALGNHERSAYYWDAAAFSAELTRGAYHQTTIFCLSHKARSLVLQNKHEKALPIFRKVLGRTLHVFGSDSRGAYAARDLAACLNQLGYFEKALPIWKFARRCFSQDKDKFRRQLAGVTHCLGWTRQRARQLRLSRAQLQVPAS